MTSAQPAGGDLALVERLRAAEITERYDDSSLREEYRGKGRRVWSAHGWMYPGDVIIEANNLDPKEVADAIERLVRERDECRRWHEAAQMIAKMLTERTEDAERDAGYWKRMYECAQNANSYRQAAIDAAMKK